METATISLNSISPVHQAPQDLSWWENNSFLNDYQFRRDFVKAFGLKGFCIIYLPHYVQLEPADFHPELLEALDDELTKMLLIIGFRGSAKSTFGSLAFPVYAALEKPDKYPFILPIADTGLQAAINVANIKHEFDNNSLIKQDYGLFNFEKLDETSPEPTLESEEDWQAKNMLLSNGVRILARSRGQKVRGLRHRQHRPKLVIVDDPEDLEWVHTKENRDKTEKWLRGEIIPAMDEKDGKLVLIGNQLHMDALLARMINSGLFKCLEYPLIRADGTVTWKGKYPTAESIEHQKKIAGATAWMREYLLKVVPDEGQVIKEEDIHYYDSIPAEASAGLSGTGVDLAISKKLSADFTAMISGSACTIEGIPKIYINANPVNEHFSFHETINTAVAMSASNPFGVFFVEDVAFQKAAIQEFERSMIPVEAMKAAGDKRSRLQVVSTYIKNGTVLFPRKGCEDLLMQLLGFGIEQHDDLVDALVYLIMGLIKSNMDKFEVVSLL